MENMTPLSQDLTKPNTAFDITRGLESLIRVDKAIGIDPATTKTAIFSEGMWAKLSDTGTLVPATATPSANSFPIFAGNGDDRSDVHATGMATILMGGRFLYKTVQYDTVGVAFGAYVSGLPLTLKQTVNVDRVLTQATGTDPVLARVITPPASAGAVMEIEVVRS